MKSSDTARPRRISAGKLILLLEVGTVAGAITFFLSEFSLWCVGSWFFGDSDYLAPSAGSSLPQRLGRTS